VITNKINFNHLEEKLNLLLKLMNEWFNLNMLSLNYDKTCCMKFAAKQDCTLKIKYNSKDIHETNSVTCLGMTLGNNIMEKSY
jgi:hypothetical protein